MQPLVFEPALKQYPRAYRAGDPQFDDEHVARRWYAARRSAIDVILAAISDSPYADSLVMRGSTLLRTWYGQAAREPGDVDFVVVPAEWRVEEARTAVMFDAIAAAAEDAGADGDGDVRIVARGAVSEDIWTYDRVPGRRLLLPWEASGLPGGWVQLDFVFNEHLPVAPELVEVPAAADGPGSALLAVTPELSLAWKIMWLVNDAHSQGKDLYDAVLLAEHTTLRYEVLRDAFENAEDLHKQRPLCLRHIAELETEWKHFVAEYPAQPATDSGYVERLTAALAPTFSTVGGKAVSEYEASVFWLERQIEHYRGRVSADPSAVRATLFPVPPLSAIVIIRELLGRETTSVEEARRILVPDAAWAGWKQELRYGRAELEAGLKSFGLVMSTDESTVSTHSR